MGHQWTREEDDWLRAATSYDDYCQLAGSRAQTKSQARNRRQRLRDTGEDLPKWAGGPTAEPETTTQRAVVDALPDRDGQPIDRYYELVKEISDITRIRKAATTTIEWTAPIDGWIGIAFPGDLHIGGPIDYGQLEADLDLIEQTEGLWCIGLGDYSNNFQAAANICAGCAAAAAECGAGAVGAATTRVTVGVCCGGCPPPECRSARPPHTRTAGQSSFAGPPPRRTSSPSK